MSAAAIARIDEPERHALEVSKVSRIFKSDAGDVHALDAVSLDVAEGEFVTLVGPSGCGKSTLLRLLAGLDFADGGSVTVEGEPVVGPSLSRGMLFQDHRLLPWMSVSDNVGLGLHKSGLGREQKRDRVQELIELVGLKGFENSYPYQLSGGMSQRAAIARSLAPRPRVLLLDEPLGALDSLTRAKMQTELLRIWEHEAITMLMVTHDVEEAVFLSDRVIVMHPRPGRIAGTARITLPKPRDRGDAEFARAKSQILKLLGSEAGH